MKAGVDATLVRKSDGVKGSPRWKVSEGNIRAFNAGFITGEIYPQEVVQALSAQYPDINLRFIS